MEVSFVSNPEWVFYLSAYWQGLGAAFLVSIGVLWLKPYFDNHNTFGVKKLNDPRLDRPFWERMALAIPTMVGLMGAIFSIGSINFALTTKRFGSIALEGHQSSLAGNDSLYWTCVLGAITSIALARYVRAR